MGTRDSGLNIRRQSPRFTVAGTQRGLIANSSKAVMLVYVDGFFKVNKKGVKHTPERVELVLPPWQSQGISQLASLGRLGRP